MVWGVHNGTTCSGTATKEHIVKKGECTEVGSLTSAKFIKCSSAVKHTLSTVALLVVVAIAAIVAA